MKNFILPDDYGLSCPKKSLKLPDGFTLLVLHVCCAPCATAVLECLRCFKVPTVLFFYNPNIHPRAEYEARRDELAAFAAQLGFKYEIGDYCPEKWFELTKGHEHDPERAGRCSICFTERLTAAAAFAKQQGASHFTTTLATSRWKSKAQVDAAGFSAASAVNGPANGDQDWRSEGRVGRRYQLIRESNFYNQRYCGCIYSKITAGKKIEA